MRQWWRRLFFRDNEKMKFMSFRAESSVVYLSELVSSEQTFRNYRLSIARGHL